MAFSRSQNILLNTQDNRSGPFDGCFSHTLCVEFHETDPSASQGCNR